MSHIMVSAEKVLTDANKVINTILDVREKLDEKYIVRAMKRRPVWWKFWEPAGMTREQAIEYLDKNAEESVFHHWRSSYHWHEEQHAKTLILLAQNGDPVTIDLISARILWGD